MWAKARKGDLAPQPGCGCEGVAGGGLEAEVEGDETRKEQGSRLLLRWVWFLDLITLFFKRLWIFFSLVAVTCDN